jgi:bifunctional DNA-binding transcriptional regulator/antitoxin component of YhaV-PrlF toxin-antitoxin module
MSIKLVSFGTSKVQSLRRVALDPNLLATLRITEGDTVEISLDTESEQIVIKKKSGSEVTAAKKRASKK